MNMMALLVWFALWAGALWLAVAIGHFVAQFRWRRRAEARSFDMMVEQYRRSRL